MADNSRALETSASPDRLWAIWSDTSTWPTWNPDIHDVSLNGPLATGATGTMTTKTGGTHKIEIVDVTIGREFTVISDLPMPALKARFRCLVEPTTGGSRISQTVTPTGMLAPIMGGMITSRVVPTFDALLGGLKAHAEGGA